MWNIRWCGWWAFPSDVFQIILFAPFVVSPVVFAVIVICFKVIIRTELERASMVWVSLSVSRYIGPVQFSISRTAPAVSSSSVAMIIRTWQFASVPSMVDHVIFVFRAERSNHVVAFIDYTPFAISLLFIFILRSDSPCIGRKSLLWNTMMAFITFTGLLFMDMVYPFFEYATITWITWMTHFNFSGPGINLILIAPVPVQLLF